MKSGFDIRITFVQVMRNSISHAPWFYCSPILRMAAAASSMATGVPLADMEAIASVHPGIHAGEP